MSGGSAHRPDTHRPEVPRVDADHPPLGKDLRLIVALAAAALEHDDRQACRPQIQSDGDARRTRAGYADVGFDRRASCKGASVGEHGVAAGLYHRRSNATSSSSVTRHHRKLRRHHGSSSECTITVAKLLHSPRCGVLADRTEIGC